MQIAELGPLDAATPRPADWRADRESMLRYLKAGKLVRAARSLAPDELDPQGAASVPITFLTDGTWIWSGAIIYYAEEHDVPVDPRLVQHARDRDFDPPEVAADVAATALATLDDLGTTGR